jgi:hypothetical protein
MRGAERSIDGVGKRTSLMARVTSRGFMGMAASATGAGAALAGVALAGKKMVDVASDIDESLAKNEQLFGRNAKAVDEWSTTMADKFGISRRAALEAAGSFGSVFETIGLANRPAAEMSTRLSELAGDLASFNNASPEETLDALRSGLLGEAEPMRRFGALLSEARVKQEAYRAGIADTGAELTEQQKVQARYNLILKDTKAAQGDFERTSKGLANQQRILKASVEDVAGSFGKALLPTVKDAVGWINTNAVPAFQGLADEIGKIAARDDIDLGEKLSLSANAAKVNLGPLFRKLGREIERADLPEKMADLFEKAAPLMMNRAARIAPQVAGAFVRAWLKAGVWGKLITVAFLTAKMGGFRAAGTWAAGRLSERFAEHMKRSALFSKAGTRAGEVVAANAAEGMADQLPTSMKAREGRIKNVGNRFGKTLGKGLVIGVVLALPALVPEIRDKLAHLRIPILSTFRDWGEKIGAQIRGIFNKAFGDGIGKVAGRAAESGLGAGGLGGRAVGGLDGANSALGPVANLGARFGLRVTSGKRAGSFTSYGNPSYHSTGEAVDLGNGRMADAPKMRAFKALERRYGARLAELIYTPAGYSIKDGRRVAPIAAKDQYDHVHAAVDLGRPGVGDGIGRAVQAARSVGLKGRKLVEAVAIAGAESRYDPRAQNLKYPDHSIGLWQINQLAHKGRYGTDAQLKNPTRNARAMLAVSGGGRNWGPWSTWPKAAAGYMSRARAAVIGSRGDGREDPSHSRTQNPSGRGAPVSIADAIERSRNTVARQGGSSIAPPTWEQQLAEAETAGSIAEAGGSGLGQIAATRSQLGLTDQRIMRVTEALRNRKNMTAAKRLSLTQELGQLHTSRRSLQEQLFTLSAPAASDSDGADNPLVEALQALAEQMDRDREAREAHTRVLDDLRGEVQAQSALAERLSGTSSDVLKRAMVDLVSGGIAGRGIARRYTPGYGVEVRF